MKKVLPLAALGMLLGACSGNLLTGDITGHGGSPIVIPTGGCTIHFDGSWDCSISGAGGAVPEAVAPVQPAPAPTVEVPAEQLTPEELNNLAPGQPPPPS